MTYAEQVAALKATLEEKRKQQEAVAKKAMDEGRTMDGAEDQEFETLESEIKALEKNIERFEVLAARDKATATPVESKRADAAGVRAPVQVKNTEKLEPGIWMARYARVKAVSATQHMDPVQVAQAIYPGDDSLAKAFVQKTAVPAANTLSNTWAANLITDGGVGFADFVEYLRPRGLLGRISGSLRQLPFDVPVMIQTTGGSASWVKEGAAKPLTQWQYTRTKLAPLKVATIAAATKEMLARATPAADALIRDELARAVNARIDATFISNAPALQDVSPAGILSGVTPLTLTGTGTDDGVRCDVQAFLTAMADNLLTLQGAFWIMPERVAIALSLMQNPLGQTAFPGITFEGGTFFGLPVYVTSYADTDSSGSVVALVKGDEIFLGDEGGVDVSISDQASLVMDDAPSMSSIPSVTAASTVSMWQTNSVAFRVERFINWDKRRNTSVVYGRVNWDACAA
jgi:HK97 family phage major capsid protein